MKVLHVSSANINGISPIIMAQGSFLEREGVQVDYFGIKGKFLGGYPGSVFQLRRHIHSTRPDVIHAHYSYSGYVAMLAGAKPLILTLMGSDLMRFPWDRYIIRWLLSCKSGVRLLVQSEEMHRILRLPKARILPNGVNMSVFHPMDRDDACRRMGWHVNKTHILFASDPSRPEKRYALASDAIALVNNPAICLHHLKGIQHVFVPTVMNASDVVILTSAREGSPNVIKEAMSCNKPAVATNVGDIRWLVNGEPGYYLAGFTKEDIAEKIQQAVGYAKEFGSTKGRHRIIDLGLDSKSFAHSLIGQYRDMQSNV